VLEQTVQQRRFACRWLRNTIVEGLVSLLRLFENYLIDTAHGVILDVEATPAYRTSGLGPRLPAIDAGIFTSGFFGDGNCFRRAARYA
jgi:hypothetical protein